MKKLMIAAATAAMVGGAFAVGEAQVYDFTATIKSGVCRQAKVSRALENYFNHTKANSSQYNGLYAQGDEIGLRKQTSMKLGGVIWGCDCDTIARPYWGNPRALASRYLSGYMFWNLTANELYVPFTWAAPTTEVTTFRWLVLNRIDTMTKCEGTFVLNARWPSQRLLLQGAGFGTVRGNGCDTIVSSISGNITGWRFAANEAYGCVFCAANGCVVGLICDSCLERALGMDTRLWTAASGTWKIKYNQTVTSRLRRNPYISKVYNFPRNSGVAADFATVADAVNAWLNGLTYGSSEYQDEGEDEDYSDKIAFEDFDYDAFADENKDLAAKIAAMGSWATTTLEDALEATQESLTDEEVEAMEAFEAKVKEAYGASDES